ncbi:MAG: glycerophosphodiester phosphodiesterase [Candidatus Helarchaeales archaeon]
MSPNAALENGEFVIDSHRGAFKNGLLENSIPAFEEALKEGANVLECDIRGTRDGQVALVHNRTIDHVASHAVKLPEWDEFKENPTGPVSEHTMDYLKSLKFDKGARILSLDEFLEFLSKKKAGAQIELKEFHFLDKIIEYISDIEIDHDALAGPVVFTSFNPFAIIKLRKKVLKNGDLPVYDFFAGRKGYAFGLQGIPLGAFFGKWVLRRCKKNRIWGFMTHYRNLPIHRIPYSHEMGVKFCPRVPDDESLIMRYIENDVDGFETDNVPLIIKCIKKAGYGYPF